MSKLHFYTGIDCCVSCNEPLEGYNHHCSKKHVAAKQAAHTRAFDSRPRTPSYGERIEEGFNMTEYSKMEG